MLDLDGLRDLLGELVLDSATTHLGDLVVRVRATDLIGPLHLLCLNNQATHFSLTVLSRRERHDKVGPLPRGTKIINIRYLLSIGLQKPILGVHDKLCSGVGSEIGIELSESFQVIRELE